MTTFAGEVEVKVVPDARGFGARLEAEVAAEAKKAGIQIGKLVGDSISSQITKGAAEGAAKANTALKAGLKDQTVKIKAEIDKKDGGKFAESLTKSVGAALRNLPDAKIGLDDDPAKRAIAGIREDMQALSSARIGVDLSSAEALAKIQDLKARLTALGASSADVAVQLDAAAAKAELEKFLKGLDASLKVDVDAKKAKAEMSAVAVQAERLDGKNIDIKIEAKTSNITAIKESSIVAGAGVRGLVASIIAIAPALAPVGAASVGAMSAIAAGALAAAGAIGVIAVALAPVVKAVQAVNAANDASVRVAAAAAAKNYGLASAHDAVKAAVKGLADARRDADEAELAAMRRVGEAEDARDEALAESVQSRNDSLRDIADAERDLADAVDAAAQEQIESARRVADADKAVAAERTRLAEVKVAAARRVETAERQLASAQRSVITAQNNLNDARAREVRELEDLSLRAVDASLAERQAVMDVATAQKDLDVVNRAGKRASADVRAKYQLAYDQAVAGLNRQRIENARLSEEKAAADAAGIGGSRAVIAAQDAVADAQASAADAAKAVTEARQAAAKDETDAAARIIEATERLSRIQQDTARATTEATRNIADAQISLADVTENAATRQAEASKRVYDAQIDIEDAVTAQTRQIRDNADSIASAQQSIISAQRGVESAQTSAGNAGVAAYDKVRLAMESLSPEGVRLVEYITGTLQPAFDGISKGAQARMFPGFEKALRELEPAAPAIKSFVADVGGSIGQLAVEVSKSFKDPVWQQFFGMIRTTMGPTILAIGRTLGNLAKGFAGLGVAFQPVAKLFGDAILSITNKFAELGSKASTSSGFQSFLAYITSTAPAVGKALANIGLAAINIIRALAPMGPIVLGVISGFAAFIAVLPPGILQQLVLNLMGVVIAFKAITLATAAMNLVMSMNPIGALVIAFVGIGIALVTAYTRIEWFRNAVNTAFTFIRNIAVQLWTNYLQPAFMAMSAFITGTLMPAFMSFWQSAVIPAFNGIVDAVNIAWPIIQTVFAAIVTFVKDTLGPIFTWLWTSIIVPAFEGIKIVIGAAWTVIKFIFDALVFYVKNVMLPVFTVFFLPLLKIAWEAIKLVFSAAWSVIQVVFNAIVAFVKNVLGPVFTWLWSSMVKPAFDSMVLLIQGVWGIIKPIFEALGNFIKDNVAPAFESGVSAIKSAWDKVADIAKAPIRFIIETVINKGIIGTWNKIAGWFGVDPVANVQLPQGFATGGYISGPGTGTSDSIAARLSNGEYVVRAAAVKKLGTSFLDQVNTADKYNISGDPSGMAIAKYATGGLVTKAQRFATEADNHPYLWGGVGPQGWDCSGLAGSVYGVLKETNPYQRFFTTTSNFEALGFKPGTGMYSIGVSPTHMVGNIAGLAFEAESSKTGIKIGSAASPVNSMPKQYYLDSLGGSAEDAAKLGISIKDPIGSVMRILRAPLNALNKITGNPFGDLVAKVPKKTVDAAIDFIVGAWKPNLFDDGGYLPPGLSMVENRTGRPEPILTTAQWDAVRAGQGNGNSGPMSINGVLELSDTNGVLGARMEAKISEHERQLVSRTLAGVRRG